MHTGNPDLVALIRETISHGGPVTFDWFTAQALYHPQHGYYSSGRCRIGRRGDYFTNVSVGPVFGRMLAMQFAEIWELLGRPDDFTIVEQGAGDGDFARDVLGTARERAPEFFSTLNYCIVEPFPLLRDQQRTALEEFREKVTWQPLLAELEPFTGVHFSNELLDAMPVRLISRTEEGWVEKCVGDSGDRFAFVGRPITGDILRSRVQKIPQDLPSGYEAEVNLRALSWVENVARKLKRGFILAADYGYPRDDFYGTHRIDGTLQCYREHRKISSPLEEVGMIDITSHVDWTSVAERGLESGVTLAGFTDQHHFMTGVLSRLGGANQNDRRALQTLLHPELLGTRFQYLALGREVPADKLAGFHFARDGQRALGLT
jgi:SAM-dependent MidA family methyltransferase